jgi:hypothetical protein
VLGTCVDMQCTNTHFATTNVLKWIRLNSRWVHACVIMVPVCIVYLCFLMWRMCVCMCAQVIMELQTEPGVG